MALALYDRVQETTATTGTGSITLGGAVSGYQSFAVVGNGNTCYYTIVNGSAWEVGIGTYSTTGPTLARTTILSNSNADTNPITLVGASSVFLTYPAEKSVNLDAAGVMAVGQPLGYSDTGLLATFVSTDTDYNQVVIQNKSNSPTASANLNISNNVSTDTTGFAELGINSSAFTGTNSFEIAGAAYLASASTDLTIGTYGAYNIHFVTDSNDIDAMTIHNDGGISLGELADPGIGNIACNNINLKFQQVVTAAGTTTLTNASPYFTQFTGTNTQTLQLPDATTCLQGTNFVFDNDSTGVITIKDGAGTSFETIISGGIHSFILESNATVAGTWLRYSLIPSEVEWGTNSLQLASTVLTGGTWQGGTVQSGYGGTGLTTFTAANNALYSTGTSTLTAGTLPIAAGGTGRTSFTSGYIPYGNGTSGLNSSSSLQFNGTYLVVGGTTPLGGATNPITAFSSSAAGYVQTYVYNASNDISASADFVAYANNSTDAHGWADMGFTSSTYADPTYTVTGPNEAYILGSAPSGAGATGNLVYATDSTGSANAHQWYVGGFTQLKSAWKMQLTSTGLQLANALGVSYGGTGLTSLTSGRIPYGNGTSAFGNSTNFTYNGTQLNIVTTNATDTITITDTGTSGANIKLVGNGATTPNKYIRAQGGNFSVVNSAYGAEIFTLSDAGAISNSSWNGTAIAVSKGGTGATDATTALSNLGAQATLVSGTNIKTINSTSLLGSGNISIAASPGGSNTQVQYNSSGSFAGSANLTFDGTTLTTTGLTSTGDIIRSNITNGAIYLTGSLPGYSANTYPTLRTDGSSLYFASNGVYAGYFSGNSFTALGNVTASSDERVKTNWRLYGSDFVERLTEVLHGTYDRTDCELTQDGVSAQSLQKLLPHSVVLGEDDRFSVNYGSAAMVSAIELAKRVVEQDARIAKLEALVAKLAGQ